MSADLSNAPAVDYHFGPYRLDGRLRSLYKDGELVVLTPKAVDTLVALMERPGRVVEKDELLRAVWGEIVVGEDSLAQNVSTLRRVLGDDANRRSSGSLIVNCTKARGSFLTESRCMANPAKVATRPVTPMSASNLRVGFLATVAATGSVSGVGGSGTLPMLGAGTGRTAATNL